VTGARPSRQRATAPPSRQRITALVLGGVALAMVGASFAAVPLYRLFCQVTGYGGTTQVAAQAPGASGERIVTVRFNTHVAPDLPWSFEPPAAPIKVRLGEETVVAYRATNRSNRTMTVQASFNVTPFKAGPYFAKIECFCFTEQELEPGQSIAMPVTFFVDPEIVANRHLDDVKTVTLSYTLYRVDEADKKKRPAKVAAAPQANQ
jgi:cytochrome c oxidase assembly protein subunit 11